MSTQEVLTCAFRVLLPLGFGRAFVIPARRGNLLAAFSRGANLCVPDSLPQPQALSLQTLSSMYRTRVVLSTFEEPDQIFGEQGWPECRLVRFNQDRTRPATDADAWQYEALVSSQSPTVVPISVVDEEMRARLRTLFDPASGNIAKLTKLQPLERILSDEHVRVSLVGEYGSGKSTLLNALCGVQLVPESQGGATTAVATEFLYRNGDGYVVDFLPMDFTALEAAVGRATGEHLSSTTLNPDTWRWLGALVGRELKIEDWPCNRMDLQPAFYEYIRDDMRRDLVLLVQGDSKQRRRSVPMAADVLKLVSEHLKSENLTTSFWPVLATLRIRGRFGNIPPNVCLVDLPGFNDRNTYREGVALKMLLESDRVLLVTTATRAFDSTMREGFWRRIKEIMFDSPHKVIVVATHLDVVSGQVENMNSSASDAELATVWGAFIESKIRATLRENLVKEMEIGDSGNDARRFAKIMEMLERGNRRFFEENGDRAQETRQSTQAERQRLASDVVATVPVIVTSPAGFMGRRTAIRFESEELTGLPAVVRALERVGSESSGYSRLRHLLEFANIVLNDQRPREASERIARSLQELQERFATQVQEMVTSINGAKEMCRALVEQASQIYEWPYYDIDWGFGTPTSFQCATRGDGRWGCGGSRARLIDLNDEAAAQIKQNLVEAFARFDQSCMSYATFAEARVLGELGRSDGVGARQGMVKARYAELTLKVRAFHQYRETMSAHVKELCAGVYNSTPLVRLAKFHEHLQRVVFPAVLDRLTEHCRDILKAVRACDNDVASAFVDSVLQASARELLTQVLGEMRLPPAFAVVDAFVAREYPDLVRVPVLGDNRCFFHAGARVLGEGDADSLRAEVVAFLRNNAVHIPAITTAIGNEESGRRDLNRYLRYIADPSAWGGEIEILALAHMRRVRVVVIQPANRDGSNGATLTYGPDNAERTIFLAYNGFSHYDALVPRRPA